MGRVVLLPLQLQTVSLIGLLEDMTLELRKTLPRAGLQGVHRSFAENQQVYRSPVLGIDVTHKGWRPSEKYPNLASFPYCLQTTIFPLLGLTHFLKLPI